MGFSFGPSLVSVPVKGKTKNNDPNNFGIKFNSVLFTSLCVIIPSWFNTYSETFRTNCNPFKCPRLVHLQTYICFSFYPLYLHLLVVVGYWYGRIAFPRNFLQGLLDLQSQLPVRPKQSLIAQVTRFSLRSRGEQFASVLLGFPMPKENPKERLPSRQWSCSEMVKGHVSLIQAKKERDSEEELQKKIKDWFCRVLVSGMELC